MYGKCRRGAYEPGTNSSACRDSFPNSGRQPRSVITLARRHGTRCHMRDARRQWKKTKGMAQLGSDGWRNRSHLALAKESGFDEPQRYPSGLPGP